MLTIIFHKISKKPIPMEKEISDIIEIIIKKESVSLFFPLFYKGIKTFVLCGNSIQEILCEEKGIDPEYLKNRIQTIFLNGKAVDNVSTAIVTKNASIALSAAMPGLVGATFRKGGFYSEFRKNISCENNTIEIDKTREPVTLKLFNMISRELSPLFLSQGVYIKTPEFINIIENNKKDFFSEIVEIKINNKKTRNYEKIENLIKKDQVFLTVLKKI